MHPRTVIIERVWCVGEWVTEADFIARQESLLDASTAANSVDLGRINKDREVYYYTHISTIRTIHQRSAKSMIAYINSPCIFQEYNALVTIICSIEVARLIDLAVVVTFVLELDITISASNSDDSTDLLARKYNIILLRVSSKSVRRFLI